MTSRRTRPSREAADLEHALRSALDPQDETAGRTSAELVLALGVSEQRVLKLLHQLRGEGRLVVVRTQRKALDGSHRWHTVYRLRTDQDG